MLLEIRSELHLEIPFEISPEMHLEMHFEIPPELHLEMHFEISTNNEIYGRSIRGMCSTSIRTQRHAETCKQTARRNRNSITHAKPHPQPPYQASAWSYGYIGRCMCKTEGLPTGLGENFGRLDG